MMRVLLRSHWVLATLAVVVFSVVCFTLLAPWQLGKAAALERRNELIAQAVSTPPVPLDQLQAPGAALLADDEWREVELVGHYLGEHEILMQHRSADETRATEVVTPFRLVTGGQVILVNRGFVADPEQGVPAAPSEQTTITGRLRMAEATNPYKEPRLYDGQLNAYAIDTGRLAVETELELAPYYVQLTDGQPGALGEVPLPPPVVGSHFSYGVQWIIFGSLAPLILLVVAWRRVRVGAAAPSLGAQPAAPARAE